MSSIQRLRKLYQAIGKKEVDFVIDKDDRGEIVIYTGLVENKGKLREAEPDERHDYEIVKEIMSVEES